jgi:putative ABC transport system permease protein
VADAIPVVIGFADWRMPSGAVTPVFVIGSDLRSGGLQPWNLVEGRIEALASAKAVAVDRTYFDRLGVSGIGATAEIRQQPVEVAAVTDGIRSFTTTPFVFMDIDRARAYTGVPSAKATYLIIRLSADADPDRVRKQLMANAANIEVLTPAEFRERSRSFWLFGTGAGAALFAGALLGVIVGTVVVAQTLYASTKEHLNEFATLRAIGSSRRYIYHVILWQAVLSAIIGFSLAALAGDAVVRLTAGTALPIVITPELMVGLFVLTLVMCIGSSIAAIVQVTRIEPAVVFTR